MGCRLAWHLGYREGWRPIRSAAPLEFGTAVHKALEEYYKSRADPVTIFAHVWDSRQSVLEPEEFREHRELGIAMLRGYQERYRGKDNFEVLATEATLSRALPTPQGGVSRCVLNARLDGLVRSLEDGHLYVLEHKTFSRFTPAWLDLDHQMTAQVWLGRRLAETLGVEGKVIGVIWNGLRKQMPSPRVKQPLFERHVVTRTEQHQQVFLQRAYWQYRELYEPGIHIYPQPEQVRCAMCDFADVCRVYQSGGDWEFLLQASYARRGEETPHEQAPDE